MNMRASTWALLAIGLVGCRRAHQVGDHVLVAWRGGDFPAVIVGVEGPSKFHVHYDGFSEDWDLEQLWTQMKTLYPVSLKRAEYEDQIG